MEGVQPTEGEVSLGIRVRKGIVEWKSVSMQLERFLAGLQTGRLQVEQRGFAHNQQSQIFPWQILSSSCGSPFDRPAATLY
jgi:hypothetical protein